jgi:hypothetical protein
MNTTFRAANISLQDSVIAKGEAVFFLVLFNCTFIHSANVYWTSTIGQVLSSHDEHKSQQNRKILSFVVFIFW